MRLLPMWLVGFVSVLWPHLASAENLPCSSRCLPLNTVDLPNKSRSCCPETVCGKLKEPCGFLGNRTLVRCAEGLSCYVSEPRSGLTGACLVHTDVPAGAENRTLCGLLREGHCFCYELTIFNSSNLLLRLSATSNDGRSGSLYSNKQDCEKSSHKYVAGEISQGSQPQAAENECANVVCPAANVTCPADSEITPGITPSSNPCCRSLPGCACRKGPGHCNLPSCPIGSNVTLVRRGDKIPGSCCDTFVCSPAKARPTPRTNDTLVDKTGCLYNHEEYADGEKWTDDACTECECKTGIAFCNYKRCPRLHCDQPVIKKGACCPVCEECISTAGVAYKEGEVWKEDDCIHCTCQNGVKRCHFEECQTSCVNPRKIDGQCCPVCDDEQNESFVAVPAHCPPLNKCDRLCVSGYVRDDKDCFRCECKIENCSLSCEFGYESDFVSGESVCSCLLNTVQLTNSTVPCPNTTCNENCTLTQSGLDGCSTCSCDRCPEFRVEKCPIDCIRGYKLDRNHCLTCDCLEETTEESVTGSSVYVAITSSEENTGPATSTGNPERKAPLVPLSCNDSSKDFLLWTEGCHSCLCHKGKKMGQQMRGYNRIPNRNERTYDFQLDGRACSCSAKDAVGRWLSDNWGRKRCDLLGRSTTKHSALATADAACSLRTAPKYQILSAQAFCQNLPTPHPTSPNWSRFGHCMDCLCVEGAIVCENKTCDAVYCKGNLVEKEGVCCPVCEENLHSTNVTSLTTPANDSNADSPSRKKVGCQVAIKTYNSGDAWWETPCKSCACNDGAVRCAEIECPTLDCDVTFSLKDRCCPMCLQLNLSMDSACHSDDRIRLNGERWKPTECSTCTCSNGQVICDELRCAPRCGSQLGGPCCEGCPSESVKPNRVSTEIDVAPTKAPYETSWLFPFFVILMFVLIVVCLFVMVVLIKKCRHKPIAYTPPSSSRRDSQDLSTTTCSSLRQKTQQSSFFFNPKKNQILV